ncbi:MAG: hypothetical protein AB7N53_05965 [Candidatus Binatia bacterium]
MVRVWPAGAKRVLTYPLVAVALSLAVVIGACGDDDDDCNYEFTGVVDTDECEALADQFNCNSFTFDGDNEICDTFGCNCADVDLDVDDDL